MYSANSKIYFKQGFYETEKGSVSVEKKNKEHFNLVYNIYHSIKAHHDFVLFI